MPSVDDYLLGTDSVETVRLGIQHRLWAAQAAAIWERAGIGPGSRVLDVGCGPGYAAADLAELVGPSGRVLGVEGSPAYIDVFVDRMDALNLRHAEVRRADIHALSAVLAEGTEQSTFDAAYCRWVLSFSNDVPRVLSEIRKALRPGGRVAIQDYFNWRSMSIAPRDAVFTKVIHALLEYWESHDGSNDVMGVVPRHLREAGFTLVHLEATQRIARPGSPLWAWPDSFWPSIMPRVVGSGALSQSDADAFFDLWRRASADPDCFVAAPPVFDAVAVRD